MTVKPITGFKINGETQPVSYPHLHGKTAVEFTPQTLDEEQKAQVRTNIDVPSLDTLTSVETHLNWSISANKKQIENLKKLAQGKIYDFETDTTEAYLKSVPTGAAPYAAMKAIGGKSIVMNQLFDVKDKAVNGDIYYSSLNDNFTVADGHKVLVKLDVTSEIDYPQALAFYIRGVVYSGTGECIKSGSNTFSKIISLSGSTSGTRFVFYPNGTAGDAGNPDAEGTTLTITAQCFDLTQTFGAGNEPATVEDFEAMFPAEYYEYNAGEIVSAEVQNVKSTGYNLLDCEQTFSFETSTTIDLPLKKGTYRLSGSASRSGELSPGSSDAGYIGVVCRCSDGTIANFTSLNISGESSKIVNLEKDIVQIIIYANGTNWNASRGFTVTLANLQLTAGETEKPYSPYKEDNFPIPEAVKQLEGYGWSAGTAKNWVDFEKKVYHREVASVDLGTLSWTIGGTSLSSSDGVYRMVAALNDSNPSATSNTSNIICDKYKSATANNTYTCQEKTIALQKNSETFKNVFVYDSNYNATDSPSSFKEAMQGVMLYYELETPEEIDISDILTDDNLIEVEAGGTLTFENSHGDSYRLPVPSDVEYMINLQEATA